MKGEISKRAVDNLRAGILWDTRISGFGVRARSGRKTYLIRYGAGRAGHSRWVTIGHHGGPWKPDADGAARTLTPDLAREEAIRLLGEKLSGRDPAAARAARRGMPTLRLFSERYMRDYADAHKATRTVQDNRRNLEREILPAFGDLQLDRIDKAAVTRWHVAMKDTPVNANRCLALLSTIISQAKEWTVLPDTYRNPCAGVERYKEKKRERYLSEVELGRVGMALATLESAWHAREERHRMRQPKPKEPEKCLDPSLVAAFRLFLLTGARREEIASLRWDEIDFPAGRAMKKRKARGPEPQPIRLPPAAVQILKGLPQDDAFVFPGRTGNASGHIHPDSVTHAWIRSRGMADLADVRLHDLRHSFASVAVAGGNSLPIIGALLGHTQVATTQRYAHLSDDPLRKAADETGAAIDQAMRKRA